MSWQGIFIVFYFPLFQIKKLCKKICSKEDIPVEQEHCSLDQQYFLEHGTQSNREGYTYYTHYFHYVSDDHYYSYTKYTHYLQVCAILGLADHVWQDK